MSGLGRPAAEKMSTTSSEAMAAETNWRMACSIWSLEMTRSAVSLARAARTDW